MRASNPGAAAEAAAHAFEVAAAAPPAVAASAGFAVPATAAAWGAADGASICWPQLPQKRALAGTGLLHLGQFTMFSFFGVDFFRVGGIRAAHGIAGAAMSRRNGLRIQGGFAAADRLCHGFAAYKNDAVLNPWPGWKFGSDRGHDGAALRGFNAVVNPVDWIWESTAVSGTCGGAFCGNMLDRRIRPACGGQNCE